MRLCYEFTQEVPILPLKCPHFPFLDTPSASISAHPHCQGMDSSYSKVLPIGWSRLSPLARTVSKKFHHRSNIFLIRREIPTTVSCDSGPVLGRTRTS